MYGVASQRTEGDGVKVPTALSSTALGYTGQRRNIQHLRTVPLTELCGKRDVSACEKYMCRFGTSICAANTFPFHAFSPVSVLLQPYYTYKLCGKSKWWPSKMFRLHAYVVTCKQRKLYKNNGQ
jgi:hypothetical protein